VREGRRWGPRAIDIDLLALGEERIDEPDLVLPHPGIPARRFVLEPWAELDPGFVPAGLGRSVAELLAALIAAGDRLAVRRIEPAARRSP
jgi:2-amino-4-hydroxy-6-hydroxymethyldihydropteridine diphosphokinase